MLLCRQEASHGICCDDIKVFHLLFVTQAIQGKKNLFLMPPPTHTTLGGSADVITFSDKYLLHYYVNPSLSTKLNLLTEKCGATSAYCSSHVLTVPTVKRKEKALVQVSKTSKSKKNPKTADTNK